MRLFNLLTLLVGAALIMVVIGQTMGAALMLLFSLLLTRQVKRQTKHAIGSMIHDQDQKAFNPATIFKEGMAAKARGMEYQIPEGESKDEPNKIYIGTKPQNIFGKTEFIPQAYIDGSGYHAVQYHD